MPKLWILGCLCCCNWEKKRGNQAGPRNRCKKAQLWKQRSGIVVLRCTSVMVQGVLMGIRSLCRIVASIAWLYPREWASFKCWEILGRIILVQIVSCLSATRQCLHRQCQSLLWRRWYLPFIPRSWLFTLGGQRTGKILRWLKLG